MSRYDMTKTAEISKIKIESGLFGRITNLIINKVIPYQWEILNDWATDAKPDHSIENFSVANGNEESFPSHCITNFKIAAKEEEGAFYGMVFQDSDLAKWLEAVSYRLMSNPDPDLEKTADETIDLIGRAQQGDGYLNTYFTIKEPQNRFTNLCECHELYCAGHMIEAATAYYRATGKQKLIDIMCHMVDCIDQVIGPRSEGKLPGYPGHEEIELALVKLYQITKDPKHLKLAKYFIDERGRQPYYFDEEFEKRNHASHFSYLYPPYGMYSNGSKYEQYHLSIREQKEFVGHAVRCMYMASGTIDVAKMTKDDGLFETCRNLYKNMVQRRMYITGGIGSTPNGEMFTFDYDLPNDLVYGETCASIGLMFFMQRMLLVDQKSCYADTMERALINTCIAGMSLDGKSFFYVNPLEVDPVASRENPNRKHVLPVRPAWFGCACCPPNLARMITSLPEYLYTIKDTSIYVNLYMQNYAAVDISGTEVKFDEITNYPNEGTIIFNMHTAGTYIMNLRIPDWSRKNWFIKVNQVKIDPQVINGYARLEKEWKSGDRIELVLDLTPRRVYANAMVSKDIGKVAIQRGPLIYCLEEVDNGKGLQRILLPRNAPLRTVEKAEKLSGIIEIHTEGLKLIGNEEEELYTFEPNDKYEKIPLTFIPYYTWANRGENEMTVWVNEKLM
jgi:DUF1680 family protein